MNTTNNQSSGFYDFFKDACRKHQEYCTFCVFEEEKGKFTYSSHRPESVPSDKAFVFDTRDVAGHVHNLYPKDIGYFTIQNFFSNQEIKEMTVVALNSLPSLYVEDVDTINDTIAKYVFGCWLSRKKKL